MRDEWKVVESEDELRPGMCVEVRPCAICPGSHRMILIEVKQWVTKCAGCMRFDAWSVSNPCLSPPTCFCQAIPGRRLYRLRNDDTAADETATTKRKELEVAR